MLKSNDNKKQPEFTDPLRAQPKDDDVKILFDKTGTHYSVLNKYEEGGNISERACFIPGSEKQPLQEVEDPYCRINTSSTKLYDKIARTYNRENVEKNARKIQKQLNVLNNRTYGTKPQDIKKYLYDLEIENELSDQLIIFECLYFENEGVPLQLNTAESNRFDVEHESIIETHAKKCNNDEEFEEIYINFSLL